MVCRANEDSTKEDINCRSKKQDAYYDGTIGNEPVLIPILNRLNQQYGAKQRFIQIDGVCPDIGQLYKRQNDDGNGEDELRGA